MFCMKIRSSHFEIFISLILVVFTNLAAALSVKSFITNSYTFSYSRTGRWVHLCKSFVCILIVWRVNQKKTGSQSKHNKSSSGEARLRLHWMAARESSLVASHYSRRSGVVDFSLIRAFYRARLHLSQQTFDFAQFPQKWIICRSACYSLLISLRLECVFLFLPLTSLDVSCASFLHLFVCYMLANNRAEFKCWTRFVTTKASCFDHKNFLIFFKLSVDVAVSWSECRRFRRRWILHQHSCLQIVKRAMALRTLKFLLKHSRRFLVPLSASTHFSRACPTLIDSSHAGNSKLTPFLT